MRFFTVQGRRGSADTVRDVRGFAVKFYTDEGNFDLVGNNVLRGWHCITGWRLISTSSRWCRCEARSLPGEPGLQEDQGLLCGAGFADVSAGLRNALLGIESGHVSRCRRPCRPDGSQCG